MTKVCTKCLVTKNHNEFYLSSGRTVAACKDCTKKAAKQYRIKSGKIKGNYGRSRFELLFGQTINDWTVIGTEIIRGKNSKVLCKCKCGKEQIVMCCRLESKKTKGCKDCYPKNGSNSPLFKGIGEISISYLRRISWGAYERNIDISITADEIWDLYIKQNKKCALTGLDINFGIHTTNQKTKLQSQTASLDRIDSKKGYTIENVQWIHKDVNVMKNRYDNEYFKYICKLITKNDN